MEKQSEKQKQAEISYRKKLQQGKFVAELESTELLSELKARNKKTFHDLNSLNRQGYSLSPFLEIGAERGQRSMLLASKFGTSGIMLDLSFTSLNQAKQLVKPLKLPTVPQAICADAYHLPFKDNSFSFIFIYQTLHHFPNPKPILKEAKRLLKTEGTLFFNEEPIKQSFNLKLWRRPTKLRFWERPLKWIGILHFISEIGKTETDAGILETSFDLQTWEESLNIFANVKAILTVFPFGPTKVFVKSMTTKPGWLYSSALINTLLKFLGGNIQAICKT